MCRKVTDPWLIVANIARVGRAGERGGGGASAMTRRDVIPPSLGVEIYKRALLLCAALTSSMGW